MKWKINLNFNIIYGKTIIHFSVSSLQPYQSLGAFPPLSSITPISVFEGPSL